jgi:cold shock CspA family protein
MNKKDELLDFCRVKKIFDKGFGFLTSIYFEENVFFHFSKVRDQAIKETLQNMKRGVIYVFYTSQLSEGKRKVKRLWTDIKKVDTRLIPIFVDKIIDEFQNGRTNVFETAHVIKLLREANYLDNSTFKKILELPKITKTPSVISSMLTEEEIKKIKKSENLVEEAKTIIQ